MKKSSHQKLKEENQKLRTDIYNLVMKEQSFDSLRIREVYRMKFGMTDMIMSGSKKTKGPFLTSGFIPVLTEESKKDIKWLTKLELMPPALNEPKRQVIDMPL